MHTKHLWVLLLCPILNAPAQAQSKIDSVRKAKDRHLIFSWSTGLLFIHNSPGQLAISFPYYSSNSPSPGEFKSTLGNSFTHNLLLQDYFNLEFYSRHHSIDFHVGLISDANHRDSTFSESYFIAGGYSHTFS